MTLFAMTLTPAFHNYTIYDSLVAVCTDVNHECCLKEPASHGFSIQEDYEEVINFEVAADSPADREDAPGFVIDESEPEFFDASENFSDDVVASASGWRPGLDVGPFLSSHRGRMTQSKCCGQDRRVCPVMWQAWMLRGKSCLRTLS